MTPKEKAEDLFMNFYTELFLTDSNVSDEIIISVLAKKCAIISVEEIINLDVVWLDEKTQKMYPRAYDPDQCKEYFDEVLTELKSMK